MPITRPTGTVTHFLGKPVDHVGISSARLNRQELRELKHPLVLDARGHGPVAVVIPYEQYMEFQERLVQAEQLLKSMTIP